MSAHRNAGYGLVGFSFPIGPDGRPLVHPTAHPAIETDFPSYVGGWWRRSRRLFWVAFFRVDDGLPAGELGGCTVLTACAEGDSRPRIRHTSA